MKIHEYQARQLFRKYGIPVPEDVLCYTVSEVEKAARDLNRMVVVKAQVLVGGRGKAGGVKLARNVEEAVSAGKQILGMDIKGFKVEKVLVADAVDIAKEYYVGLINDRNTKTVTLMASSEGGVEIEEVAKVSPEKIIKFHINPLTGQGI
jgi:succinyl-CoA synthetase beta subunit